MRKMPTTGARLWDRLRVQKSQQARVSAPNNPRPHTITNWSFRRLEELEDEVRQLRSSVSTLPPSISRGVHDRSAIGQSWDRGISSIPTTVTSQPVQSIQFGGSPTSLNQDPNSSEVPTSPTTARSLGHLELSSTQIDTLFQLYAFKQTILLFPRPNQHLCLSDHLWKQKALHYTVWMRHWMLNIFILITILHKF